MKRLLPLLLALVLVINAIVPAYATGDGNFDGGGGSMGDGTKTNYWNPGMDGVRVSVIHADSQAVTGTVFDLLDKVTDIKGKHLWNEVIDEYREKKNLYLCRQDYNHPSFNVYVETVNQVFNKYFD